MASTMEQLLFLQEDISSRVTRGRSNFMKTPKERLTIDLAQTKLEALEKLWEQFVETHAELCKTADPKLLKASLYMTQDLYESTEELYIDYKCLLKKALPVRQSAQSEASDSQSEGKSGGNSFFKLPKIIIPKFSGNYNEWTTFRDLYKSLVHDIDMDKSIKMQYLKGLLGGEAEQLVRNMSISEANYDQCWATLIERYNNKRYLCNTILQRLFGQRSSSTESASFLKEILDNTTECMGALANLGVDVSTWDLIIIYMTALKLDHESRKQWELQSVNCNNEELPRFKAFQEFLTKRFRALEFVSMGSNSNKSKAPLKSFHIAEEANTSAICNFCKEQHRSNGPTLRTEKDPGEGSYLRDRRASTGCLHINGETYNFIDERGQHDNQPKKLRELEADPKLNTKSIITIETTKSIQEERYIQADYPDLKQNSKNAHTDLHRFSNASKLACTVAVEIQIIDEKGEIPVKLVTAKSKVAPISWQAFIDNRVSEQKPADFPSSSLKQEVTYDKMKNEEINTEEIKVQLLTETEQYCAMYSCLSRLVKEVRYSRRFKTRKKRKEN
ncbi:Uncharacterized protein OBRU01_06324 [Operophtera brumata]|uniref:Uncharacterized protein n=1 Tax=Operophtera brumata TaxID=104452 RepID=A0A0L7LCE8_OPEBR|nr:Uncharacterized protein OBRU01_06324 [Operophtera brumata]